MGVGVFLLARYPCTPPSTLEGKGDEAHQIGEPKWTATDPLLTQCIHSSVLESQPPHKIVNLISWSVIVNKKLTIFGGVDFRKLINEYAPKKSVR